MKRFAYSMAGAGIFGLGLGRRMLRKQGVISVFHRVDDALAGNPISVTRARFAAYLQFFAAHFDVIRLGELLGRLKDGRSIEGAMVITFDDGYLDNYENAAPALARFGLPACFFVTSGLVGSTTVPRWDRDWGIRSRWMDWDQVRSLHRGGHEIGAHTVSHPNLGVIGPDEARSEMIESRTAIESAIGAPVPFFCYPFGGPHQLSEANREIARQVGFDCCLAAYGGTVRPGDDPFRLLRFPVSNWHRDPYHYGLQALRFANRRSSTGNSLPQVGPLPAEPTLR